MRLPITIFIGRDKSKNGKQWMFRVRFADGGKPFKKFYATEREAKELKAFFEKAALTMPMADIRRRLEEADAARGGAPKVYPTLSDAVSMNLARLEREGELRGATIYRYKGTQRKWVTPELGTTPVDQVTRKMVGAIIAKVKEAGLSNAIIDSVRHPIRATHERLIADEVLPAAFPNPGTELSEWVGKKRQKKQKRDVDWFTPEVGIALLRRCEDDYPRRYAFLCTGMLAGLRWGESVALQADDIEWDRGTVYVQRTWSEKAKVVNALKDSDKRRVPLTRELRRALKAHDALLLAEAYKDTAVTFADDHGKKTERRVRLAFPNRQSKLEASSGAFHDTFWTRMQREAGLAEPKKYHSTRHTFATWALESGEEPFRVMQYLGHASLQQTLGTYYHARIGNRGELGGMEKMLELPAKML